MGEGVMVAGIGCRAGVSGAQVEAAIDAAIAELCARQVTREPAQAATASASNVAQAATTSASTAAEAATASASTAAEAARPAKRRRATLTAIATPVAKINEPGIRATAAAWGVPLLAISQEALEAANPATLTRSTRSMATMNVHSVAEAAALAGALALANVATTSDPGPVPVDHTCKPTPRLLQPRVVVGPVTCALADTTTS